METLEELRAQLEHAVRTADDIHSRAEKENRTLTADETKHQEEVFAEAETLKKRIKELEDFEERRKKIEEAKAPSRTTGRSLRPLSATASFGRLRTRAKAKWTRTSPACGCAPY